MRKILIVNANTTETITATMEREARAVAAPGTIITAVTARFGPRVIGTRAEATIAAHAALEQAARNYIDHDVVMLAVSLDCGLEAVREILPIPAVGMMEAALHTGCMLGGRIGLVIAGRRCAALYQELVSHYGLSNRIAGIAAIDHPLQAMYEDPQSIVDALATKASKLVEENDADVVILAGAIFTGMWRRIQERVHVPVLDGIACAIRQAELLVSLGVPKAKTGSYAEPPTKELIGVDEAIVRLFSRMPPTGSPCETQDNK